MTPRTQVFGWLPQQGSSQGYARSQGVHGLRSGGTFCEYFGCGDLRLLLRALAL